MKNTLNLLIVLALTLLFATSANALDLAGQWKGALSIGQQQVPIIFNVAKTDDHLSATMDSPMQGATGIPVESVIVAGSKIAFDIKVAAARYEAQIENGKLIGTWKQSGQTFALNMSKGEVTSVKKN